MKLERQPFFLLRTPLLSLGELEAFHHQAGQEGAAVMESLCTIFNTPLLKEALFVASPELYQEFDKYLSTGKCPEKAKEKLQLTLLKYLIRSCTRATPYGLFAGCTVGLPATATRMELGPMENHHRYRRLDTNYLSEIVAALLKHPIIADNTKYFVNSSLYAASDRYRYAEYTVNNGMRRYNLVAVDRSDYLKAVIDYAGQGAYKIELVEILEKMGIDRQDAADFIDSLIAEQVLLSELEPTVTGDDFLEVLLRQLSRITGVDAITGELGKISQLLQRQDTAIEKYRDIQQVLGALGVNTAGKDFIQTDLFLDTPARQLHEQVLDEIIAATESIGQVTGMTASPELDDFKRQFYERYEEQEIPLAIALDSELGIGYGNNKDVSATFTPLVDGIMTGNNGVAGFDVRVNAYNKWQLDGYLQAITTGSTEMVITEEDVAKLRKPGLPFLPSAYIFGSLYAKDAAAVDAGEYSFYLKNFAGSSAANLLGRFCAGNEELAALTRQAVQTTEADQEGVVYAEIVHLPQTRLGNILSRPFLRNYEIVYLGNSYLDPAQRTGINDLYVSVRNNEVILRSQKLGKRVLPRLTTAHNYAFNSLPIYQFLCDLQFQQTRSGYAWVWTEALNGQAYFPRVRYRHLVLSRAHWKLSLADCGIERADLKANETVAAKLNSRLSYLTGTLGMPRKVIVVEGDNELLADLSVPANIDLVRKVLLKRGVIYLYENLQEPDQCFVRRGDQKFTNEIIIPVRVSSHAPAGPASAVSTASVQAQRSFPPGSNWQYFKIYCGTNTSERVLREVVQPLVQQLQQELMIDKWFFIRYADPHYHLRVRFHHTRHPAFQHFVHEQLNYLTRPFIEHGLIHKLQTDTYNRELERYGHRTIVLAEEVFYYESEWVLSMLSHFQTDDSERDRWLWTLKAIDALFEAAGIRLPDRLKLATEAGNNFVTEFGGEPVKDQLATLYHRQQKTVEQYLSSTGWLAGNPDMYAAFNKRNEQLKEVFSLIQVVSPDAGNQYSLMGLLPSFIHMFVNRAFTAKQRKYEMVLYYFLTRFYKSQIARGNQRV